MPIVKLSGRDDGRRASGAGRGHQSKPKGAAAAAALGSRKDRPPLPLALMLNRSAVPAAEVVRQDGDRPGKQVTGTDRRSRGVGVKAQSGAEQTGKDAHQGTAIEKVESKGYVNFAGEVLFFINSKSPKRRWESQGGCRIAGSH